MQGVRIQTDIESPINTCIYVGTQWMSFNFNVTDWIYHVNKTAFV